MGRCVNIVTSHYTGLYAFRHNLFRAEKFAFFLTVFFHNLEKVFPVSIETGNRQSDQTLKEYLLLCILINTQWLPQFLRGDSQILIKI